MYKYLSLFLIGFNALANEHYSQSWGYKAIGLVRPIPSGPRKVKVAIIDTGIDCSNIICSSQSTSVWRNVASLSDTNGHGSHVSGIVRAIAPNVELIGIEYYREQASGKENLANLIKAFKYAIDIGVDIINISGGGPKADPDELNVLKLAEQKGIVVVSAAGNERADLYRDEYFPASYALSNLITVMNYQQNGELNSSSNWNGFIAAPGTDILSTLPNKRLGTMTGTSQATPMVTGTLALLLSYRKLTPTQLKYILSETSDIEYSQLRKTSIRKLNLQKVMKYATQN